MNYVSLSLSLSPFIYIYTHIYTHVCVSLSLYIYIHIIHIHILVYMLCSSLVIVLDEGHLREHLEGDPAGIRKATRAIVSNSIDMFIISCVIAVMFNNNNTTNNTN